MQHTAYTRPRVRGVPIFAFLLCLLLLPYRCNSYTEVFSVAKDSDDNTYLTGNRDSNFFIAKKSASCELQWESTEGSTSGDDDNDINSEVLYDAIIGRDGAVYATGTTRGDFSSPSDEVPNLDAAVLVYDPSNGNVVTQKQYDIAADHNNVARAIVQKEDGNLLVAVYGSVSNVQSAATYETRILELDSQSLEVQSIHEIDVTTTGSFAITGGPKLLDMIYEESTDSIIAVGHILGRGILWKYSLLTDAITSQVEWGEAFGNFQISGFTSDGNGAYFVVGSSSERVLENADLLSTVSTEFHAYVIRYDNLDSSLSSATWVRQLAGAGSSQSGSGIAIDPVSGDIVVVGDFDADFTVTDGQTSEAFTVTAVTDDGITDVFLWYLDPSTGDFNELRSLPDASTDSEDHGNTVAVLSSRTVLVGGITNDGNDATASVCDKANTLSSSSPSISPSASPTSSSSMTFLLSETPALVPSISSFSSTPVPSSSQSLLAASTSASPTPSFTAIKPSSSFETMSSPIADPSEIIMPSSTVEMVLTSLEPATGDMFDVTASSSPSVDIIHAETDMSVSEEPSSMMNTMEAHPLETIAASEQELEASQTPDRTAVEAESSQSADEINPSDEHEFSVTSSPVDSSNAVFVSFQSKTPSFSFSPFPSVFDFLPAFSQDIVTDEVVSPSVSLAIEPLQVTPNVIPSMSVSFSSVDLGTPKSSSSQAPFETATTFSSSARPSSSFGFDSEDFDDSLTPSTSSMVTNEANFNPTPSSSTNSPILNLGTTEPKYTADSLDFQQDIEAEESLGTEEPDDGIHVASSNPPGPSAISVVDELGALSSTPDTSGAFSADVASSLDTGLSPTGFDAPVDPSSALVDVPIASVIDSISGPTFSEKFTLEEVYQSNEIAPNNLVLSSPISDMVSSGMLESPEASQEVMEVKIVSPLPSAIFDGTVPSTDFPREVTEEIQPSASGLKPSPTIFSVDVTPSLIPLPSTTLMIMVSATPSALLSFDEDTTSETAFPQDIPEEGPRVTYLARPTLEPTSEALEGREMGGELQTPAPSFYSTEELPFNDTHASEITVTPEASATSVESIFFPINSNEVELQQAIPTAYVALSDGPALTSVEVSEISLETPFASSAEKTMESEPLAHDEAFTLMSVTPVPLDLNEGSFTQQPTQAAEDGVEALPPEFSVISSETAAPIFASGSPTNYPTETGEAPEFTSLFTYLPSFTPTTRENSGSGDSRIPDETESAPTPSATDDALFPISSPPESQSPMPSESVAIQTSTPGIQDNAPEPSVSFIDIVTVSATPSLRPIISGENIPASPAVSGGTVSTSPTASEGTVPADESMEAEEEVSAPPSMIPSVAEDNKVSATPSMIPSRSGILAPTLQPTASFTSTSTPATLSSTSPDTAPVSSSATPTSSSSTSVSNTVQPSSTIIEIKPSVSPSPFSMPTLSSIPVNTPNHTVIMTITPSNNLQNSPTASSSPTGEDLTVISPPSQVSETPSTSKGPVPVVSKGASFSKAPTISASPSRIILVPSEPSSLETETSLPPISSQPSSLETSNILPSISLEYETPSISLEVTEANVAEPSLLPSAETIFAEPSFSLLPHPTNFIPVFSNMYITDDPETSQNMEPGGEGESTSPLVIEKTPFLLVSEETPSPLVNEETPSPLVNEEIPSPLVSEETPSPLVNEEIPSPLVNEETPSPLVNPSEEQSKPPSMIPSPSGTLSPSMQPTVSSTSNPTPAISFSTSPSGSASPTVECVTNGTISIDPDSLQETKNFQRVNMMIQVAGPVLTNACQFTAIIAERFIRLSAANTLSQADMWHITSIEDGPPVFEEGTSLVPIEQEEKSENEITRISPSPSNVTGNRISFPGSVRFNVTAFMDRLSVELASGPYVEYIDSQNIVKAMIAEGFDDIQWIGMVVAPMAVDERVFEEETRATASGLSSGEVSAIAIGSLLIIGVAGFVIVEGGLSMRRSGPILPI